MDVAEDIIAEAMGLLLPLRDLFDAEVNPAINRALLEEKEAAAVAWAEEEA